MPSETEALAIAARATADAAFAPVADFIRQLAGPAAEELGLTLRDHVRVFRFERQLRLWSRVKEMVERTGIPPHMVPLKLLGPVIQSAELEEDDGLQDRWAALLTNAATDGVKVHPAFIDILRQLTSLDAQFLDRISKLASPDDSVVASTFGIEFGDSDVFNSLNLENLERLGLIWTTTVTVNGAPPRHGITKFGSEFIRACREPKNS
jgi:hypothetical protein